MAINPGQTNFIPGDILTANQYNLTNNTVDKLAIEDNSRIVFPYSTVPANIVDGHWVLAVSPGQYVHFAGTDEVLTPSVFLYVQSTTSWLTYPLYYGATGEVDLINYSDYIFHKANEDFVYYKNLTSTDKSYTVPFIYKCTVNTTPGQSPENSPGKWERISIYIDVQDVEDRLAALELNNQDLVDHLTDYENPHQVTKLQVGLSDVDNTSDSVKPISIYTQQALDLKSDVGHTHTISDITDLGIVQDHIDNETIHFTQDEISITVSQISDFTSPTEIDPVFTSSPAAAITTTDITNLSNLSGINTGDQDLSGYALTTHNHTGTYEPANSNIQSHISAVVAHGTVGNIVGTIDLQTLSNKTLDANTVNNYIKFLPVTKPVHQQGILYYDSVEDALSYYNSVSGMSNQIGREIWVRAYNNTGALLPNGHAVTVVGAYSGTSTIDYAEAKDYDKSRVVGITTMNIPNGTYGYVTFFGRVNDIDTSAYAPGTLLYLNNSAPGHYSDVLPIGGEFKVRVGRVVVQDATVGAIEVHVGQSEYTVETISERGFPDKSLLTLSWSDATRTLTVTPVGGEYRFYQNGELYRINTIKTYQITDVEGSHFIYFDADILYDLVNGTNIQYENLIRNDVPVVYLYWDATNKTTVAKGVELHWSKGYGVENHIKDHGTEGARYADGLALTDIILGGNGSLASHAQFGSQSGTIYDEDIKHSIPAMVSTIGATKILYRNASLYPRSITNVGYSVATTGTGRLAYSPITGGLLECPDNTYVWYHVFAFGSIGSTDSIVTYMGTNYFSSTTNAYNGLLTDVVNVQTLGLPTPEFKLIASVLFQTRDTYANNVNARIVAADTAGSAYVDWRKEKFTGGSGVPGEGGSTTSSFSDLDFNVYDNVDATKIAKFQADGITTATTRLYTFPDKDGTFAMLSDLGASAGHTIQDSSGAFPTRTNLKFTGNSTVSDNSIGDATVVDIPLPTANQVNLNSSSTGLISTEVDSAISEIHGNSDGWEHVFFEEIAPDSAKITRPYSFTIPVGGITDTGGVTTITTSMDVTYTLGTTVTAGSYLKITANTINTRSSIKINRV